MADITKCTGLRIDIRGGRKTTTCPFRKQCERFTTPANSKWQSWFTVVPLKTDDAGKHTCDQRMSHWTNQVREPGSTVIAHAFVKSEEGSYCRECGSPKENHP